MMTSEGLERGMKDLRTRLRHKWRNHDRRQLSRSQDSGEIARDTRASQSQETRSVSIKAAIISVDVTMVTRGLMCREGQVQGLLDKNEEESFIISTTDMTLQSTTP